MKTSAVTTEDLKRSVLSVPPLAWNADFTPNREANGQLIRYLEDGGVSTLLYGGNANFYNLGISNYGALLEMLTELAGAESWIVPSVGPDYGKMMDQAPIAKALGFPTVMVLPLTFPTTPAGVVTGIRRVAEAFGRPVILYIKLESYIEPEDAARLVDDGLVCAIKYAIVRQDPKVDPCLTRLLELVERRFVISGIGERPAIVHLRDFGLPSFTSGSVCIAPRASTAILRALQTRDYATAERLRQRFLPFEDRRDELSPLRVLHDGVTLAGIADMGPLLPLLTGVPDQDRAAVAKAARDLKAFDATLAGQRMTA